MALERPEAPPQSGRRSPASVGAEAALGARAAAHGRLAGGVYEFLRFGVK